MTRTSTPDKSYIAVSISISQHGSNVRKSIKFRNRKGTFAYSPTCDACSYSGKVQDGLGYGILSPTCDRDGETWRKLGRYSYREPRTCKFFKEKIENTDPKSCETCAENEKPKISDECAGCVNKSGWKDAEG